MRDRIRRLGGLATCLLFAVICPRDGFTAAAFAQPTVQRATPRVVPLRHGRPLGPRHVFGTILAIDGNTLSVRRRNGKLLTVDATTVIASDDYSYPLFVGKTVAIDGTFSTKTTFLATHINAVTTLQSLEADK